MSSIDQCKTILKKEVDLRADAAVLQEGKKRTAAIHAYGGYACTLAPQDEVMLLNGMGKYGDSVYGVGMFMLSDTTVRSLTGIAIRYKNDLRCLTGGAET